MNLFDALDWSVWKSLSREVKVQVISQLLIYFVSPLKKVSNVHYQAFSQGGIKCETFEFCIDGEPFVFVPGNKEAILGWDLGMQGLPSRSCENKPELKNEAVNKIIANYQLQTKKEWSTFINESTSPLRKAQIEPMFVQKYAQPIGTTFIGKYDMVTGNFEGDQELFSSVSEEFYQSLGAPQTFEESLSWTQPYLLTKTNSFVAMQESVEGKTTNNYFFYTHTKQSYDELMKTLNQGVYSLMNENQWEYVSGAGSRRLFRWGSDLAIDGPSQKYLLEKSICEDNMFGLSISGHVPHWELIDSPFLKLEKWQPCGMTLMDAIPQSTYYRSRHSISKSETLHTPDYFYRKAIIIQS